MNSTIVWIVAIVVVLILLALVVVMVGKGKANKREGKRTEAADIRQDAATHERTVQRHEAEASEQEASARQAHAESDRQAATAAKLDLAAQERGERASATRTEQHERLRQADEIDPDVPAEGSHEHAADGDPDGTGRREGPGTGPARH